MSVQRKSSPPPASPQAENDLETTAELPVLDVAAYEASAAGHERVGNTDTWIMPPQALRESRESHETQEAGSAVGDAKRGGHLEVNLHALSDNLREVEERLKRKGERLTEIERSLEETHARRAAAEENAQQLAVELAQSRAAAVATEARIAEMQRGLEERDAVQRALRALGEEYETKLALRDRALAVAQRDLTGSQELAASYFESLQSTEGRRSAFEGISATLYWEIDERDARLASLHGELSAAAARARELESELHERAALIDKLEKEINALATSGAQRDEQLRATAHAGAELQRQVDSLTQGLAGREERIRALESTSDQQSATSSQQQTELERAIAEQKRLAGVIAALETGHAASVATLQANLSAGNERIRTLESRTTQQNIEAAQRQDEVNRVAAEHEATAGMQRKRAEQLEAELTAVRIELQQRSASLQEAHSERSEHMARIAAGEARAQELEARMAEQQDVVRVLQADSNASVAHAKELEGDLRAAEEMLNRMETELRTRSTRLEEFEKTNQEWRVTVEDARRALTDRDSLIRRLEDEMAQSSVLLGSIQQSITRLDATGTSTGIGPGPTHDPAPDGDKRLLIRSEGDSDVVHVLGRKTSVGRTPDNDLQIDAKFISRHHAVILAGPAHTIIEDLNSTNGVLVNGRRITRQTLKDGDSVVIGKTQFRFAVRPSSERRN